MTQSNPRQPPDFKQVRRYLTTAHERAMLDCFIAAGWTAADLGEYAHTYRLDGYKRPTAVSYRRVIANGPDHPRSRAKLDTMRQADYVLPPFERPNPEDPEYTGHTEETRADIENLAWRFMARAVRLTTPKGGQQATYKEARETAKRLREEGTPVPPRFWRRAYHALNEHQGDPTKASFANELWMYA